MSDEYRCSFCKKSQREVRKLIAGPDVYICDECVDICVSVLIDGDKKAASFGQACRICQCAAEISESLLVNESLICARCLESMRPYFSGASL